MDNLTKLTFQQIFGKIQYFVEIKGADRLVMEADYKGHLYNDFIKPLFESLYEKKENQNELNFYYDLGTSKKAAILTKEKHEKFYRERFTKMGFALGLLSNRCVMFDPVFPNSESLPLPENITGQSD